MVRTLFVFLIFMFSLASCSSFSRYEPVLNNHVLEFEKLCNCKVNIPITIEPIPSKNDGYKTLGVCYVFRGPMLFRSIRIDKDYWAKASFYQRESTVFHELAHCVLDLEHDERMTGEYIWIRPKSIMYPYSFPQYETYRKEYLKELFLRKPGSYKP
jgi:hypothetical protein